MGATALFMLVYGIQLCVVTQYQTMAEFPWLSAGARLPADPGRRPAHAALHHRARLARRRRRRPRSCTATRPRSWSRRWTSSSCSARSRCCARSACRSPTRSGLAALVAALWVDIPLEAVMLKISDGTDDFALLAIPFFVLAGAHHGRRRHGGAPGQPRARSSSAFIRGGLALVNILASTLFGCISGSSVADTASIGSVMIPQMVKAGLPARVRHQRHDLRLGAGAADPAVAQRGDLLARRRRHDLGRAPVPRRHLSRAAVRPVPDRPRAVDRAQARLSRRASRCR